MHEEVGVGQQAARTGEMAERGLGVGELEDVLFRDRHGAGNRVRVVRDVANRLQGAARCAELCDVVPVDVRAAIRGRPLRNTAIT